MLLAAQSKIKLPRRTSVRYHECVQILQEKKLQAQLRKATSFEQWAAVAQKIDARNGANEWRAKPGSDLYHGDMMAKQTRRLRTLRERKDYLQLTPALQEAMYRHLAEISNPQLYDVALLGSKFQIEEFLQEVREGMLFLANGSFKYLPKSEIRKGFEQAYHNYGRSALMLSGGMAFGIYHLGVTKALFEQDLLPHIISGSSMGSIVAGGICTRSDEELAVFYLNPDQIHHKALRYAHPAAILKSGQLYDPAQLIEHISANMQDMTFHEAWLHTGRVLNITVSPTRTHQKPRILNHLTAPDVLVRSAVLASCSIPGVFPPVQLQARNKKGKTVSYMGTELWVDGSVYSDIPMERLSRLLNVNHSIVSQANPLVIPFVPQQARRGLRSSTKNAMLSLLRVQTAEVLGILQSNLPDGITKALLEKAHAVTTQSYLGDININLPFDPLMYRKLAINPDIKGLRTYIRLGEQATWPKISIIRDQTLIGNTFKQCLGL